MSMKWSKFEPATHIPHNICNGDPLFSSLYILWPVLCHIRIVLHQPSLYQECHHQGLDLLPRTEDVLHGVRGVWRSITRCGGRTCPDKTKIEEASKCNAGTLSLIPNLNTAQNMRECVGGSQNKYFIVRITVFANSTHNTMGIILPRCTLRKVPHSYTEIIKLTRAGQQRYSRQFAQQAALLFLALQRSSAQKHLVRVPIQAQQCLELHHQG